MCDADDGEHSTGAASEAFSRAGSAAAVAAEPIRQLAGAAAGQKDASGVAAAAGLGVAARGPERGAQSDSGPAPSPAALSVACGTARSAPWCATEERGSYSAACAAKIASLAANSSGLMTSGEFVIGGSLRRNSASFKKSMGGRERGGSKSADDVSDPSSSSSSSVPAATPDAAALRAAAAALALRRLIWAFVGAGSPPATTAGCCSEGRGMLEAASSPPLPLPFPAFLGAAAPPLPPFAASSPADR